MLNIKEIFKSDLDPNSANWWAKDKVDKLNFNFNQLSSGGPGGPIGVQGVNGQTGVLGTQGFQGYLGNQGFQGVTGPGGLSTWRQQNSINARTILPSFQGGVEYSSITLLTGALDNSITNLYSAPLSKFGSSSVFNSDGERNNFSLSYLDSRADFKLFKNGNETRLNIGNLSNPNDDVLINNNLGNYNLNFRNGAGNVLMNINSTKLSVDQVKFNKPVSIIEPESLHYSSNAGENNILVSNSPDGDVIWKNKYEVFSALPVGSVIAIRESDFNDTLFHIDDPALTKDAAGYLRIVYGRGREGGMYGGWYLANGQTWGDGVLSFDLPNLNSFEFNLTIGSYLYEGPEIAISQQAQNPIIISGGIMDLSADYITGNGAVAGSYDITHQYNSNDDFIDLSSVQYQSNLQIKRNINIINLGEESLYWQTTDTGSTQTSAITLSTVGINQSDACSNGTQTYQWTGGSNNNYSNVNNTLAGVSLYTNNNGTPGPSPSAGWYSAGGVVRYWSGSSFTSVETCPTVYTVMLKSDSDLKELNGLWSSLNSPGPFTIDTPAFKDATTLSISGYSPAAGWYREKDQYNHFRRYWDGGQFIGTPIPEDFVYVFTTNRAALSTSIGVSACSDAVVRNVYFGKDQDYGGASTNIVPSYNTAFDNGGADTATIYVEVSWNPNNVAQYQYPLIKASDQFSPNSNTPYAQLVVTTGINNNKKIRGPINSSSKLGTQSLCQLFVSGVYFDSSNSYQYAGIGDVPGGVSTEGVLINTTSDTQYLGLIVQDNNQGFKVEYKRDNSALVCLSKTGTDYPSNSNPWVGQCLTPVGGSTGPQTHFIGTIPANTSASDNYTWENAFADSWTTTNINGSGVNVELFYGSSMATINQLVGTI